MVARKSESSERSGPLDFNPGFTFDFASDEQPQAAWEFTGALKQAREKQFAGATSIDDKIQKRLNERGAKKQAKAAARKKKKVTHSIDDEDMDDSDGSEESEDSEDKPLPGELDEDDSSDDGIIEEDEDEERLVDDEAEEDDEDAASDKEDEEGGDEDEDEENESDVDFINDGFISEEEEEEEEEFSIKQLKGNKKADTGKQEAKKADEKLIDVEKKEGKKEKGKKGDAKLDGKKDNSKKEDGKQKEIGKQKENGKQKEDGKSKDVGKKKEGKVEKKTENGVANGHLKDKGEKVGKKGKKQEPVEEEDIEEDSEAEDDVDASEEEEDVEGGDESDEEEDGEDAQEEEEEAPARKRQKGQNGSAITPDKKGKKDFFADKQGRASSSIAFEELHLSRPLLKAITSLGYKEPTPIQAACVPLALAGRDICGSAVTGSGKTAAYALPILERLLFRSRRVQCTYVLVLAPTRELAVQVHSMIEKLAQFTDISAALAVGGLSLQAQSAALKKSPEILVATPGRLIDHVRNTQSVGLEDLAVLILDEADRLLEMGFKDEIHEIIKLAPKKRQTMLFSATFSTEVNKLVSLSLKQPVRLAVDPSFMAPEKLCQEIVRLKGAQAAMKEATLLALCSRNFQQGRTIIFTRTKQKAHRLKILFGLLKLPSAGELHGNMTQAARLESLEKFRLGEIAFLLATDVAARGLDIGGVQTVINFDAPRTLETYMHRVGRTARAGATGRSITLVEDADRKLLKDVMHKTKADMKARLIAPQAISAWQGKVEGAGQDVARIMQEERMEKEMRKAEMQVTKAQNMLDHEDEIMARPARTWFQTPKEKVELQKQARVAYDAEGESEQEGEEGRRGAKKSAKVDKANRKRDRKIARAAEEAETKKRNRNKLKTETEEHSKRIKSIKAKTRELVQEQGLPISKAAKIASAAVTGIKKQKKKKKKTGDSDSPSGLFEGTGKRDGETHVGRKATMSTLERNRLKRGGKSKNAFKSKRKFKRR